jgi:hypothetical protein
MMKVFLFLLLFTLVIACDSPRNHRVSGANSGLVEKSAGAVETFQLAGEKPIQFRREWVLGPYGDLKKVSTLVVYVYGADQKLASLPQGFEINFYASMPDMGHGMDDPGYFEEVSPGIYLNQNIHFTMGGPWTAELWLQNSNFDILDKVEWQESL